MNELGDSELLVRKYREEMRRNYLAEEYDVITGLISEAGLSGETRDSISARAERLVQRVRGNASPTLIEKFLAEYGLTTDEGVALMCLAEALLRVPDDTTMQALIDDKVGAGDWAVHLGHSESPLINITTWGLMVTGRIIRPLEAMTLVENIRRLTKRLGDPMVRTVAAQAMKEMGRQFVLGRTIAEGVNRANQYESMGYTHSYDMLGEAACTEADAMRYFRNYADAITSLMPHCVSSDIRNNPGISIKLSALHPRFEATQKNRVVKELVPLVLVLARQAKAANMGFNIDAEEADRLDLSLDVIETVLSDPTLKGWNGFGVVVQAYGKRASSLLDWLHALAEQLDRRIMVRLVKGAYWDAEIKQAQVLGLTGFPVFTRKACSDVSFIACAAKLLRMRDRIYPQFATHNAHSVAAILQLAGAGGGYEFQRLHGMGESLHEVIRQTENARCRIYAPVGRHRDLLAYLVRRLLENGANSSFVNQIVDTDIAPETIAADPFAALAKLGAGVDSKLIAKPRFLYGEGRWNARGWDISDPVQFAEMESERARWRNHVWEGPPGSATHSESGQVIRVFNPANPDDLVGEIACASQRDAAQAVACVEEGFASWSELKPGDRAELVAGVGDLFEQHAGELFSLLIREAGKTLPDAIAEVREAVDFARYYSGHGLPKAGEAKPRGIIACISPWNFPLAIFSGQVLANLAAGNVVLAKPAEQTSLIAMRAVELMHEAGIPSSAVQVLVGEGGTVGHGLTSDSRISGVCFTGSSATAASINRVVAENLAPDAPLVAETGGLNAMVVDSTALPEQVVRDVMVSAFQSAGQRCSALRMLYLQRDIAEDLLAMLFGAMDELVLGDPWAVETDVGPVIDRESRSLIEAHCAKFESMGRIVKRLRAPDHGHFAAPTVIRVTGIAEVKDEIFGPVLHVATFAADEIEKVIDDVNSTGYGLTFGVHSRVNARVELIAKQIRAGNLYVNRNQIGAIVGSQPFGGEGLSGTGPKAGGPHYVRRFMSAESPRIKVDGAAPRAEVGQLRAAVEAVRNLPVTEPDDRISMLREYFFHAPLSLDAGPEVMPGPTGELNLLSCVPRGIVVCAGPDADSATAQAVVALSQGNRVVAVAPGVEARLSVLSQASLPVVAVDGLLAGSALSKLGGIHAVASTAEKETLREYRRALADRKGVILPLITEVSIPERYILERHLCVDTTAAGGNASLVASSE